MTLLYISSEPNALPVEMDDVDVYLAGSAQEALDVLPHSEVDAAAAVFPLPGWNPEELLEAVRRTCPDLPLIIAQPGGTCADAVRLIKLGAFDFIGDADVHPGALAALIRAAHDRAGSNDQGKAGVPWRALLVGQSRPIEQIAHVIALVAPRKCTVLISGDTGTGKEMVARAIHLAGNRAHLPIVAVNCSALPEHLLEAELFGHVKGAFTGALFNRIGRFEQAHRGTLFLDEVGDLPLETQAKLLRVLQEREFQRLGSSETVRVDVRVIAATNADLAARVREGKFREDLYYRLNVVPVFVPPLRERSGDIPLLVRHFIGRICRQEGLPVKRISLETMERLASYTWPGNVRQLENAVEMAVVLSGDRETLYPSDFPLPVAALRKAEASNPRVALPENGLDFEAAVDGFQRQILEQALKRTGGNKKQAAEMLRLKRTTLTAKLRSLEAAAAC